MSQFQGIFLMLIAAAVMLGFIYTRKWREQAARQPGRFDLVAAKYTGYAGLILTHKWPSAKKVVEGIHRERTRLIERAEVLHGTLQMLGYHNSAVSPESVQKLLDETFALYSSEGPAPSEEAISELAGSAGRSFFHPVETLIALADQNGNAVFATNVERWKSQVADWCCVVKYLHRKLVKLGDSKEPWYGHL